MKTQAVLLENGIPTQCVYTTLANGVKVAYGFTTLEKGGIVQAGVANISRNKKYLQNNELMYILSLKPTCYINQNF